jgi:molybdate transport system ATP-binding protein
MAIHKKFKVPVLIVSHDLPDLLSIADQLILIKNGEIIDQGKFQQLISKEVNLEVMNQSGLYNVLNVQVFAHLEAKNLVLLKSHSSNLQIQALQQTLNNHTPIGRNLKVLIRPENIALSKNIVPNISLRNQVKGTIKKIFLKNGLAFCLVDVGENIIAEVTEASTRNLKLEPGETVYCLFKSAALKIF